MNRKKATDSSTLIVSMTSYPARIKYVHDVIQSILRQNVDKSLYKIVLCLAETEFPSREKNLPSDLQKLITDGYVELLWHKTNILSHKKLIPALIKYPDNPILVTDDDTIRQDGWLQMFIDDHNKYPDEIICGTFAYVFDTNLTSQRLYGGIKGTNSVCGLKMQYSRPANGLGGVLYPAHTFDGDKRFFDEKLLMEVSPTSDESWQYCFNILAGKTFRQSSRIYDNFNSTIQLSQLAPNTLSRINNYAAINNKLFECFPEFEQKLKESHFIVSMTSHGKRLTTIAPAIESIFNQKLKADKVVLTIYKDDEKNVTEYIRNLVDSGKLELIVSETNIRPHLKYYEVMRKYKDVPIITVDDDIVYPETLTESLWKTYRRYQNCICAARIHGITVSDSGVLPYRQWVHTIKQELPSHLMFATGVGGILYPPDALEITEDNVEEIKKCITADDVYLKWLERKRGMMVVWSPCDSYGYDVMNNEILDSALNRTNVIRGKNDEYLKDFPPVTKEDISILARAMSGIYSTKRLIRKTAEFIGPV